MGDIVAAHGEAVEWRRKMKTARPESNAWTEFVGVYRLPSGAYGAAIWDPSSRTQVWLGTFGTAEDAARAYGAAAVKLPGASKKTDRSESDARTEFRGVYRLPSGAYGASIWDPSSQTQVWLGTFDTVEHAAGAYGIARAYGAAAAAAAKLPGAREKRIRSKFRGVRRSSSGRYAASIRESKGKALTWLGTFGTAEEAARAHDAAAVRLHGARAITNFGVDGIVGGARHHGVSTAELQHVDELLKDMECTNEKEALIDAAAILHQIARGGHGDDEHS